MATTNTAQEMSYEEINEGKPSTPPPPQEGPADMAEIPLATETKDVNDVEAQVPAPPDSSSSPLPPAVENTTTFNPPVEQNAIKTATNLLRNKVAMLTWRGQLILSTMLATIEWIEATVIVSKLVFTNNMGNYSIAVGVISMCFTLGLLAIDVANPQHSTNNVMFAASIFLCLWWFVGVVCLTFFYFFAFTILANGFFATWGVFLLSLRMLHDHSGRAVRCMHMPSTSKNVTQTFLMFLLLCSVVEFCAGIVPQCCDSFTAYAISVGVISTCITMSLLVLNAMDAITPEVLSHIGKFLVLWWIVGAGINTLGPVFQMAGNGYFASFGALASAYGVVHTAVPKTKTPGDRVPLLSETAQVPATIVHVPAEHVAVVNATTVATQQEEAGGAGADVVSPPHVMSATTTQDGVLHANV